MLGTAGERHFFPFFFWFHLYICSTKTCSLCIVRNASAFLTKCIPCLLLNRHWGEDWAVKDATFVRQSTNRAREGRITILRDLGKHYRTVSRANISFLTVMPWHHRAVGPTHSFCYGVQKCFEVLGTHIMHTFTIRRVIRTGGFKLHQRKTK